ncbi:cellulase family glycosylhydrolase, partial [Streptomyces sp. MCAF7]
MDNNVPTVSETAESKRGPRSYRLRVGIAAGVVVAAAIGGTVTAFALNSDSDSGSSSGSSASATTAKGGAVDGPLSTRGGDIVDSKGHKVVLTGINWFGAETGSFAPHGLWTRSWKSMLDQIADNGFNTIRLPYSNEMFAAKSKPNGIDFKQNPDLKGLTGQQIMDKIVKGATDRGMMVILDQHRPDQYGQSELWYS